MTHRRTPFAPMKIDAMTDVQLVAYLDSLIFEMGRDKTELALLCTTGAAPCVTSKGVPVFIQPEWGMDLVDTASIPSAGLVVARIINFGDPGETDHRYGFPAQQRSFWYVDRDAAGTLRSRYFYRTHNSTTGPAVVFLKPVRPFWACRDHPPSSAPAMAKWRNCNNYHLGSASQMRRPTAFPMRASYRPASFPLLKDDRVMAVDADTWVKCHANCCTG